LIDDDNDEKLLGFYYTIKQGTFNPIAIKQNKTPLRQRSLQEALLVFVPRRRAYNCL